MAWRVLPGDTLQFSLRHFYDSVCLRILTFIECKLFCNNVIESLAALFIDVFILFLAAIIACIAKWKSFLTYSNFVCDLVKYFSNFNAVPATVKKCNLFNNLGEL